MYKEPHPNVFLIQTNEFCDSSHLLHEKNSWVGTWMKFLNEDLIDAVVIAVKATANEPKNKFGASTGSKPMPSAFALQYSNSLGSGWFVIDNQKWSRSDVESMY